ncbi:MAG: outer membrane protein assembly factor BamD [Verrucomicrobia bacterium]|nr:outer membrane protein assembly factor BamD [Verrucomicrobiota bacterium]
MNSRGRSMHLVWALAAIVYACSVCQSPAPLIYTPGEGWRYEKAGAEGKWFRTRAADQLEVAQKAFEAKDFSLAKRAAARTVSQWPFSDYAPAAQLLLARSEAALGNDEKAFKAYQKVVEKYPRIDNYDEVLRQQFEIANKFLAGKWFRLFGTIPLFPSMDKTIKYYDQIVKSGPYSSVGPEAQMNIGAAHEKKIMKDYPEAARAYNTVADRYSDRPVAGEALFKAGNAYLKQAKTSEYDQSISTKAIDTFTDLTERYKDNPSVPEAKQHIEALLLEQARGNFQIARFYDKRRLWEGAQIYYNEVINKSPESPMADDARRRIEEIKRRLAAR